MAQGYSFGSANVITIDASDLQAKVDALKGIYKEDVVNKALYRTLNESGRRVKSIMRQDLPIEYEISGAAISKAVKSPRISGGSTIQCIVPISGSKHIVGGSGAKMYGRRGGKYGIRARIVKGAISNVTNAGASQGGQPAFVVHGLAFARKGRSRFPIIRVAALSVAQMPVNRSEDEVMRDVEDYVMQRFEHNWSFIAKV